MSLFFSALPPLLQADAKAAPAIKSRPANDGGRGLDAATADAMEVDKLFDSINQARTRIGQASLYRTLLHPPTTLETARARQAAVAELSANPDLRDRLSHLLDQAASRENHFYDLLYAQFMGAIGNPSHPLEIAGYGYESYIEGTRFLLDLVKGAEDLAAVAGSEYLQAVLADLRGFKASRAWQLMQGPVYRTEKRVCTAAEKSRLTPAVRFRPGLFKPTWLLTGAILLMLAVEFVPGLLAIAQSVSSLFGLFVLPLALLYIPLVGSFDRDACIHPLRDFYKTSPEVAQALEALGRLDELSSLARYPEHAGVTTCLPELTGGETHSLVVAGVRNPVLGQQNPDYVPNDIELKTQRVVLLTGPNSGGKTAFAKTLAQVQLLGQIGGYVPAKQAALGVADHIFYQIPEISHLADGEGRFGTELRRTKEIFVKATARSLVLMDELSEGTTHEEKIEISLSILEGFHQKGNTTLLITHNHELVDRLLAQNKGLARQVEFRDEQPTYRVIEGISRVSHAERVAKKIGFSREDIARYLSGGPNRGRG
jgi:hypothetical protein